MAACTPGRTCPQGPGRRHHRLRRPSMLACSLTNSACTTHRTETPRNEAREYERCRVQKSETAVPSYYCNRHCTSKYVVLVRVVLLPVVDPPRLLNKLVAARQRAVDAVALRVRLVVVLVVLLRRPKGPCGGDLGHDGSSKHPRLAQLRLEGPGRIALLVAAVEDGRAVLRAGVDELSVHGRRIDVVEEGVEQVVVRAHRGVIDHLHRLGVARHARAHLDV
mmetsp:Transcript_22308/g.68985  ORF Transcript_22308/g.68985 Transcript_22308/m.68985 type:complete len:221 (+) Transcript_22308:1353-2015(+)